MFISSQIVNIHESKELRELFKSIDTNGDGKLSKEELWNGFIQVNSMDINEEHFDNIMKEIDTDGNGYIDYIEFLKATMSKQKLYSKEHIKQAFDLFDLDKSGKISSEELQQVLSIGNIKNGIWQNILRQADTNSDGEIDFEEFSNYVLSLSKEIDAITS